MSQEVRDDELEVTFSRISGTWENPQTKRSKNTFGFLNKTLIFFWKQSTPNNCVLAGNHEERS